MEESRYCRNRIYISKEEQESIADCNIVFGGAGIGSIIAECALRAGFENIHIIDGDKVELSNLNRQNYTTEDIGKYKAEVMFNRLKSINPDANISYSTDFLDAGNIKVHLKKSNIAINALDFNSDVPFLFDDFCMKRNIPVLHPYNLGWAGFVTIILNEASDLRQIHDGVSRFELKMGKHIATNLAKSGNKQEWLESAIKTAEEEKEKLSPPQLSIASWITAGLCTDVLYQLATQKAVKTFPDFYYASTRLMSY